jgi:hypothetical protein
MMGTNSSRGFWGKSTASTVPNKAKHAKAPILMVPRFIFSLLPDNRALLGKGYFFHSWVCWSPAITGKFKWEVLVYWKSLLKSQMSLSMRFA